MNEHPDYSEDSSLLEEKVSEFKNYINQGMNLIIDGNYQEAMEHFNNQEELSKIGKSITPARDKVVKQLPQPSEYGALADWVARNSWIKGKYVELSTIIYLEQGEDQKFRRQKLPNGLEHEISLIHLEEWLHCLQDLQREPLAEQRDKELDVALYMERNNVPLTDAFKGRYNRKSVLRR